MSDLRDRIWEALYESAGARASDRVDRLYRLIQEEKTESYNLGYQDGYRKDRSPALKT